MPTPRDLHKLAYLDALGLQLLVAREVLPGAAPSAPVMRFERRAVQDGTEAAARVHPSSLGQVVPSPEGVPVSQPTAPPEVMPPPSTVSPKPQASPVQAIAPTPPAAQALSFSVVAIVSGGCLWLQATQAPELPPEQLQLIRAMAFARCSRAGPGRVDTAQVTRFDWPLHRNRQLDLSAEAAAAALTGFVLRQLRDQGCGGLVLLGERAGHYLLQPELDEVATVRLPDTAEMMAEPAQKREAWVALMALEQ